MEELNCMNCCIGDFKCNSLCDCDGEFYRTFKGIGNADDFIKKVMIAVRPKIGQWIPVKFRPMDSEEREYWEDQFGEELADEDAVMFDCPMPEDGQEILVSYRKWIAMDKCEIDGGCYGLEGNGDWDDVTAWMPLPEPYKDEVTE